MGLPGFYGGSTQSLNVGSAASPYGGVMDYLGNPVPSSSPTYIVRMNHNSPLAGMPYSGPAGGRPVYAVNPNYQPAPAITGPGTPQATGTTETATPPHYRVVFDAIGTTIYRSIGHCRLPLRTIWAQGINWPGAPEDVVSPTLTFAAALCAPIDPSETGQVSVLLAGSNVIYDIDQGGIIIPDGISVEDANALALSLQNAVIYPGDEAQLPAPLIVADKGADKTNAFRGIRYIILPLYPLIESFGFNNLTVGWTRTNDIGPGAGSQAAVEFAAGAG